MCAEHRRVAGRGRRARGGNSGGQRPRGDRAGRSSRVRRRGRDRRRLRRGRGGVELGDRLVAAAARHGLPVCGPNCNGIAAPATRTALWGDALAPAEAGSVALVSQSGNVAVNALATRRGLRFHTVISSGNQAVLGAADYLEFLATEEGIGAVALYLEDDGGPRSAKGWWRARRPTSRWSSSRSDSHARGHERRPRTALRSPATSGYSGAWSKRRARSGRTTSTTCSSSPRRSPCPGREPRRGRGRAWP